MQPADPYSAVKDVLLSGAFERFTGMREGPHFEAKGKTPYDFATPAGRYELAKDVSAFANTEGGHIVIGLTTRRVADEKTDEVQALDFVVNGESLISQIQGVLKECMYPQIRDLQIDWLPSPDIPQAGLVSIFIPRQEDDRKFFLITRTVEDNEEVKRIVVGIAYRTGADSIPLTPQELHRQIRDGHSSVSQRLTRLEAKIDSLLELQERPPAPTPDEKVTLRIKQLLTKD